jgi:FMN phosphatase YigB (HAD superfamily)
MSEGRPVVTFDLWHTLVYLAPEAEELYMRRQIDLAVDILERSKPRSGTPRQAPEALRAAFEREYVAAVLASGEGRTVTPAEQFQRAAVSVELEPDVPQFLDALERVVHATPFQLAPGVFSALGELRDYGYGLGVISNTVGEPGRFLRPMLTDLGFDDYVENYTFSDEHPWSKPAPEIFRTALGELDSDSRSAVHVGDGWSDIEGGRRAGLVGTVLFTGLQQYGARYRTLFMPPDWHAPPADHTAGTLAEAVPIVRRLLPPPEE